MLPRLALSILLFSFILNGCASLSKDECSNANWNAIGYRDGSHGKSASRFDTHQKACAKYGLSADFAVYKDGHQRGLAEVYCKPGNGYRMGLKGMGYNNVCPASIAPAFRAAYRYGREINKMQRSYNVLKQKSGTLKADLAKLDERIALLKQDNHGDELGGRANHEKQLRRERRRAEAQYDHIKLTRPMILQSQTLVDHLQQELTAHNQRVERYLMRFINKLGPQDYSRRQFRRLVRLSNEKGEIESQMDWLSRRPGGARDRRQQTKTLKNLQRQLRGLLPNIDRLKYDIIRRQKNKRDQSNQRSNSYYEARLEQLIAQAAYEGALKYHNEVLEYMESYRRDQSRLYLLIDAHFEAELVNLDQRISHARHRQPTEEEWQAQMQRKRELHDALRQHDDDLHRLEEMERQMDAMQQKIEKMKSDSRY